MAIGRSRFHRAFALALVAAAPGASAPRGEALLREAMLALHNDARASLGVPPLRWDKDLARDASTQATSLAREGRLSHPVLTAYGENLWSGSRGDFRYDEMVSLWLAERPNLVNAPVPRSSRTGRWTDVEHYAQMIWRGTTAIGCAIAANDRREFLVCRYAPSGNMMGQKPY